MYAIVRTGGKQFCVKEGDVVKVPLMEAEVGKKFTLDEVLFVRTDDKTLIGNPTVKKANVTGEVVCHGKDKKILVYTYKRRKGFEKRQGHRQEFTRIKISKITA